MERGNRKGPNETDKIIRVNFNEGGDGPFRKELTDRIKHVADLVDKNMARPAEFATASSIPPAMQSARVISLKGEKRKRVVKKRRMTANRRPKAKTLQMNDILTREKQQPVMVSIAGGKKDMINPDLIVRETETARRQGYAGVYRIYRLIKNTLPEKDEAGAESADRDKKMSELADRMRAAVQELEVLSTATDEDGEKLCGENPDDIRLFNAVASVLIRVWPHNFRIRLNDFRVNTMVLLLTRGDISWRKMLDLMVEWEKTPPQNPSGKWSK